MENIWKPSIQKSDEPMFINIVRIMSSDISRGVLPHDSRLPTQRELADSLHVALGTITRAYKEAERRGLIRSEGRRGTFVGKARKGKSLLSIVARAVPHSIDLSKNHPDHSQDPDLAEILRKLVRHPECQNLLHYPPVTGHPRHLLAGARWLEKLGLKTDPESVTLTCGAQHALMVVLGAESRAGDIIAVEEYSYPGVKSVADILGLELAGVAMDEQGLIPEALDELCRHRSIRLLYCNPTLQNPSNTVMPEKRRREIADICESNNVIVVEDEILSPLVDKPPVFLSALIPHRSYLVMSASKAVAAGLRVGFVTVPENSRQKIADSLQATCLGVPPLTAEIFAAWLEDGTIDKTILRRRHELSARNLLVNDIFREYSCRTYGTGFHVWLVLPENWTSMRFAMEAQFRGVAIAPAEVFAIDRKAPLNAVRLSIGAVPSREILKAGLGVLHDILIGKGRHDRVNV